MTFLALWLTASFIATALWGIAGYRLAQARQQPSRQVPERDEFEQVHGELN